MNRVQPIRSQLQIAQMKEHLRARSERDYMIFVLGINVGVRIGDLLKLTVGQVQGSHMNIIEEKRGKDRVHLINHQLRQELDAYISSQKLRPNDYLFRSRQGGNRPITRVQAYRILRNAAESLSIENVGTHTLRKTFGYWHYRQFGDVALLQTVFRHSSPAETLRYIGIQQDEIDESTRAFFL